MFFPTIELADSLQFFQIWTLGVIRWPLPPFYKKCLPVLLFLKLLAHDEILKTDPVFVQNILNINLL